MQKDKPQRRRMNLEGRLKDDRGNRRDRDNWANGGDRFDRSENPQSSDFQSTNDGTDSGNLDDPMFDTFGGQGRHVAPFASEMPPPVLMPVPGAGYVDLTAYLFCTLRLPGDLTYYALSQSIRTICSCST